MEKNNDIQKSSNKKKIKYQIQDNTIKKRLYRRTFFNVSKTVLNRIIKK
jgi:hypothetical protein